MIKLITTLTSNDSPLEEVVLETPKVVELSFDFIPSINEVLFKLEPIVYELKNNKEVTIGISIVREDGASVFNGTSFADGRLSGVSTTSI